MVDRTSPAGEGGAQRQDEPPEMRERAQQATGQAQEKAQEVAGQAQEKAQEATGQAQDMVREQIDQRSSQAGEKVSGTAEDLRSVGEELRKQGKEAPAKLADRGAERFERLGSYLRDADGDRLLSDVEDFGRRQPLAVLAGGLAVGMVAARFLKASSHGRYRSRSAAEGPTRELGARPSPPPPRDFPAEPVGVAGTAPREASAPSESALGR